jgi:hypothetical protein
VCVFMVSPSHTLAFTRSLVAWKGMAVIVGGAANVTKAGDPTRGQWCTRREWDKFGMAVIKERVPFEFGIGITPMLRELWPNKKGFGG